VDVKMICPLHGPVWRENLDYYINKYQKWSRYEPEDKGVAIFYGSMYGHTESVANSLALLLAERGMEKLAVYDISETDLSEMIGEMFRVSHWVLAAPTYNGGLYPKMEWLLHDAGKLNLKNRKVALIENGSWAPAAGKEMKKILEVMENITLLEPEIKIKSALKKEDGMVLENLADAIVKSLEEE
jgi:flavorubredoxin